MVENSSLPFAGHTAVVTGASKGIGRAIAEGFLAGGAQVIGLSLEDRPIEHPKFSGRTVDLSDPAATRAVAAEVATGSPVDILVNNAGIVRNTLVEDIGDAEFDTLIDLHLRAALSLAQAFLPGMKARAFGRIVNMSSRAIVGLRARTVYGATKAALVTITRTWAMELGPFGITVNAIAPGPIVTDMLTADMPEDSEAFARLAASLPTRRLGRPEDIARAVLFFADPANGWITGQNLFVCGGGSLGSSLAL